jgi:hypothetical protein
MSKLQTKREIEAEIAQLRERKAEHSWERRQIATRIRHLEYSLLMMNKETDNGPEAA